MTCDVVLCASVSLQRAGIWWISGETSSRLAFNRLIRQVVAAGQKEVDDVTLTIAFTVSNGRVGTLLLGVVDFRCLPSGSLVGLKG